MVRSHSEECSNLFCWENYNPFLFVTNSVERRKRSTVTKSQLNPIDLTSQFDISKYNINFWTFLFSSVFIQKKKFGVDRIGCTFWQPDTSMLFRVLVNREQWNYIQYLPWSYFHSIDEHIGKKEFSDHFQKKKPCQMMSKLRVLFTIRIYLFLLVSSKDLYFLCSNSSSDFCMFYFLWNKEEIVTLYLFMFWTNGLRKNRFSSRLSFSRWDFHRLFSQLYYQHFSLKKSSISSMQSSSCPPDVNQICLL